jgi:hypothetical protein
MFNFCYIFKNSGSTFEIDNSIKLVRKHWEKEANIVVIGDNVNDCDTFIRYHQNQHDNRSARVNDMLLTLAKKYDRFVLMYDDIFFTRKVDLSLYYVKGNLSSRNSTHGYEACKQNTKEALLYFDKPFLNYDCHNPFIFESDKLIELYKVFHGHIHHLPKSLYANYYGLEPISINDLKSDEIQKIKDNINKHGMFSTTDTLSHGVIKIIKDLQNSID